MIATAAPSAPPLQPRDLILAWAKCLAIIAVAFVLPIPVVHRNLAGVAAFAFIAVPDGLLRRRHEHWDQYGLPWWGWRDRRTWSAWTRGLLVALAVCIFVLPVFTACFTAYAVIVPQLPSAVARVLAPYALPPHPSWPGLPPDLAMRLAVQFLVVALPEELFYRGFVQTAWERTEPEHGVRVFGARLGKGFLATQALFAIGHLVVLQPWRLATFFPGLLFGWLRARTGNVAAGIFFHAFSNLFIALLEASFYR